MSTGAVLGGKADRMDRRSGQGVRRSAEDRAVWRRRIEEAKAQQLENRSRKRTGLEVDHSPARSTDVKNEWRYTSTPLLCAFMAWTVTTLYLTVESC